MQAVHDGVIVNVLKEYTTARPVIDVEKKTPEDKAPAPSPASTPWSDVMKAAVKHHDVCVYKADFVLK